jgi:hypothetical protein
MLWLMFIGQLTKASKTTCNYSSLIPKGRSPFFRQFLKFRQAIVDVIFVQKISNFWWICGLVLASRRSNFYKISVFGDIVMPQK